MAGTKFAYVRNFERPDPLLPDTFAVFRLDGHSFHRFSEQHEFAKPNDKRALELMDHAARDLMEDYPDIVLAIGESDEYSFLLRKSTSLYNRRESKILSTLTSRFTSSYLFHWSTHFPSLPLKYPPSFDGRLILYPSETHVQDYFRWRQADTHINNLYNTTFWALVQQGGLNTTDAHKRLKGTYSKDKNEILFSEFGVNYSKVEERFRKGSILVRRYEEEESEEEEVEEAQESIEDEKESVDVEKGKEEEVALEGQAPPQKLKMRQKKKKSKNAKPKSSVELLHCDIIKGSFWEENAYLLQD